MPRNRPSVADKGIPADRNALIILCGICLIVSGAIIIFCERQIEAWSLVEDQDLCGPIIVVDSIRDLGQVLMISAALILISILIRLLRS